MFQRHRPHFLVFWLEFWQEYNAADQIDYSVYHVSVNWSVNYEKSRETDEEARCSENENAH